MGRFLLLALLALSIGCKKDDFDIQNLNGGKILALGHGGMGIHSTWPMNSAASLAAALYTGADGIEIDVQLTRDSVLVAFHDTHLGISTDAVGVVADHNWEQVSQARYLQPPYADHRVVQLRQFFAALGTNDHIFYFDVKLYRGGQEETAYRTRMADALASMIQEHGLSSNVVIECQDVGFLLAMRARIAGTPLYVYRASFEEALDLAVEHDLKGVVNFAEHTNGAQIAHAHSQGKWVVLYAKTRKDQRASIELNPEIILSDRLDHLLDLLD